LTYVISTYPLWKRRFWRMALARVP